jgi:hypothetical protein
MHHSENRAHGEAWGEGGSIQHGCAVAQLRGYAVSKPRNCVTA